MSGHSKWKTIKHKKGIADAKRGKAFTKVARLITIAAKDGGADPDINFKLRLAMEKAKEVNMPKDNVQRAIEKGVGKSGDGVEFKEVIYEGFGLSGTVCLIESTTDNTNRTVSELKNIFSKGGGNLGGAGSVSYLFDQVGYLFVKNKERNKEDLLLELMEVEEIDDVEEVEEGIEVYCSIDNLSKVKDSVEKMRLEPEESELIYKPKSLIKITDKDSAEKIIDFISRVEDHDDVQKVHSNFDVREDLIQ